MIILIIQIEMAEAGQFKVFTSFACTLLDIHMYKYTVAENRATERVSRSAGGIQWLPVLFSDH